MILRLGVSSADLDRAGYDAEDFASDWIAGVPADAMARRAGRRVDWVYRERKRLGLFPRNPVGYENPDGRA